MGANTPPSSLINRDSSRREEKNLKGKKIKEYTL
jgi:hypothetical protein